MLLKFEKLNSFFRLKTFITTKKGGVSSEKYKSLNLALHTGDKKENVLKNRKILAEELGKDIIDFIYLNQVHSDNVLVVSEKDRGETSFEIKEEYSYDAAITNKKGIVLMVLVADCIPIIVYDKSKKVVGVIHSGWKGTAKNILKNTILKMNTVFGSNNKNIFVGIGPSICEKNYEVGEEVVKNFGKRDYTRKDNGKYNLNLQKIVFNQALELGIADENIEIYNQCSLDNENLFFSARRDGINSGRFGVGVYLK